MASSNTLGNVTRAVGAVQDLVVEDREIESETKTDRVCWGEPGDSDVRRGLVRLE